MGCKIGGKGGGTVVLGEMDVARVKPNQPSKGDLAVHKATGSHPTSQGRPPTSGGESRSASYPVDDVHLNRII